jgi:hypothetical protein
MTGFHWGSKPAEASVRGPQFWCARCSCHCAVRVGKLGFQTEAAQDRKRARNGKCEGRRSHREMNPERVVLAKRLRRRKSQDR